jgi:hypothetical protein
MGREAGWLAGSVFWGRGEEARKGLKFEYINDKWRLNFNLLLSLRFGL